MPDSLDGSVSTISDGNTGEIITLNHKEKLAYVVAGKKWLKDLHPATNSGKSEKVGKYDTEIFTWFDIHGITNILWVAKGFPEYPKIKEQFSRLKNSSFASGWADLPGMVVRMQIIFNGEVTTVDLVSVGESSIESGIFQVPEDYKISGQLRLPDNLKLIY